nr:unnamed protein product [Haemonchus contortus]
MQILLRTLPRVMVKINTCRHIQLSQRQHESKNENKKRFDWSPPLELTDSLILWLLRSSARILFEFNR